MLSVEDNVGDGRSAVELYVVKSGSDWESQTDVFGAEWR